jgi:hypothetical protein|tara:strand:+ start:115 stop:972 length:858 start_codon:yes stop_codon:yes gene_type:complete
MKKIVAPYLKKVVKVNNKTYNLEYHNCTDELMFDYLDMLDDKTRDRILGDVSIDFQRQEIVKPDSSIRRLDEPKHFPRLPDQDSITDQWTSHTDKLWDPKDREFNFDDWFESLDDDQQMQYSQMISEANEIIATLIWEKLKSIDKEEIFSNDYNKYIKWFDTLEPENIDFYMERLVSGKRLIPKFKPWSPNINILKSFGIVPETEIDYEFVKNMFNSALLENLDDDLVRCTSMDGMLIICSLNKSRLDHLKDKIADKPNVGECSYRKKVNRAGNLVHTYIFEMPK